MWQEFPEGAFSQEARATKPSLTNGKGKHQDETCTSEKVHIRLKTPTVTLEETRNGVLVQFND